jgi:hypothetical protein
MKTDIDRLHKNALSRVCDLPRGAGKTFLACHELAGAVETIDSNFIIAKVKYQHNIDHILLMVRDVFDEHQIEIAKFDKFSITTRTGIKIMFVSESTFDERVRGLPQNSGYVDFVDY